MRKYLFAFLAFYMVNSPINAQETCENSEETIEDLHSITKCTVDNTEEKTSAGKTAKKLSVNISTSTRFLKRRVKNKAVTGIGTLNSSGINNTNTNTDISNTLTEKTVDINNKSFKAKLSKEQLKNAFEFEELDQIPLFKSCKPKSKQENSTCFNNKMIAHIQEHFNYPNEAIISKTEGNVWVRFIIDEEGNITNFKALASKKATILKQEAIRVVSKLSAFTPAVKNGKKVLAKYGFPINFSLEK